MRLPHHHLDLAGQASVLGPGAEIWLLIFVSILLLMILGYLASQTIHRPDGFADCRSYRARPLLNQPEKELHAFLEGFVPRKLGRGYHLLAQVSLGEFLRSDALADFNRINAKRADFVIVDPAFNVVATIEYQGTGHYGGSEQSAVSARQRDAVKRQALNDAGIPMIEVLPDMTNREIGRLIRGTLRACRKI